MLNQLIFKVMKKNYFFVVFYFFAFSICVNAQIRVFGDGTIATGENTTSGGFRTNIGGWGHQFSSNNGTQYLRFQITTLNPRISGTHNCVVFYDAAALTHNDIQVRNVYQYSDRNGKTNIVPFFNSLEKVKNLNPVYFSWQKEDKSTIRISESGKKLQEVGFLAQDIEQVLPEAVTVDEEGNKLVNYSAIIPLLTASLQELADKVDALEKELANLKSSSKPILRSSDQTPSTQLPNDDIFKLYQNIPNPTSGETQIKYSIPTMNLSANICVFNLSGSLILKKEIGTIGEGEISINANELEPGMYNYSLIVDDRLIDTKKMVITK